jgi:hypothetical protein
MGLSTDTTYAPATVSENGVLLSAAGGATGVINQIGWYDRAGKPLGQPAISPDERFVAFRRASSSGSDLWVHDLNRGWRRDSPSA